MSIVYDPSKLLKKIAPKKKIESLVSGNLTPKKAALSMFDAVDFIDKKNVSTVVLKTLRQYKDKYETLRDETDLSARDAKDLALNDKKLLISRVENTVINQIATEIETKYNGESYKWLPSDAEEPDPSHQLNYGKVFTLGDGEKPGDRYGCRCGMEILVSEKVLIL